MNYQRPSVILRLLALAVAVVLLWLAQQAGTAGVAGIYGASAADFQLSLSKTRDSEKRATLSREGLRSITHALELAPGHSSYNLMAADFTAGQLTLREQSMGFLLSGLSSAPARSDLWSRRAGLGFELTGASSATLHALDRALLLGPREYSALLANAAITLGADSSLDARRRLRGWQGIVTAANMPALSRQINALAKQAGMARQLQVLIREKARENDAL